MSAKSSLCQLMGRLYTLDERLPTDRSGVLERDGEGFDVVWCVEWSGGSAFCLSGTGGVRLTKVWKGGASSSL